MTQPLEHPRLPRTASDDERVEAYVAAVRSFLALSGLGSDRQFEVLTKARKRMQQNMLRPQPHEGDH